MVDFQEFGRSKFESPTQAETVKLFVSIFVPIKHLPVLKIYNLLKHLSFKICHL